MGRVLRVLWRVLAVAAVLCPTPRAFAAEPGWPFAGPAPTVTAYGASYATPGGGSSVHSGVDLASPAGAAVLSVLEGNVTFAGRVPADEGATTIAVTVESGDVRLTYMPLSETSLKSGETIEAGQPIGALAATGDRSHPEPHLHLSARRGTLYIDPVRFLLPPTPSSAEGGAETPSVSSVPQQAPAVTTPAAASSAIQPAPTSQGVLQPQPQIQPQVEPHSMSVIQTRTSAERGVASQAQQGAALSPAAEALSEALPAAQGAAVSAPAGVLAANVPPASAVLPQSARVALTADRRVLAKGGASSAGALIVLAGAAGLALLWPVWRAAPILTVSSTGKRQDVAAVVAR